MSSALPGTGNDLKYNSKWEPLSEEGVIPEILLEISEATLFRFFDIKVSILDHLPCSEASIFTFGTAIFLTIANIHFGDFMDNYIVEK